MITETTYSQSELKEGKCTSCGEKSSEILIGDGRCIDCIESENFMNETMKQSNNIDLDYDPYEHWHL